MMVLLYAFALVAGLCNPLQAGATSVLQKVIERPLTVGLVSAFGILLVTGAGAALFGQFGFAGKAAQIPWWVWCSGVIGAVVVISQPIAGPKIGAGAYIGLTVTASTIASVVIDNYGWLDFPRHAASAGRIVGNVLMVAGVSLIAAL